MGKKKFNYLMSSFNYLLNAYISLNITVVYVFKQNYFKYIYSDN
jgi:hypothetical protein